MLMQTSSLQRVRPSWVAFGWFVGAAVSALVIFALIALGVLPRNSTSGDGIWVALALLIGFMAGGFLTGARVGAVPALHGVLIGAFSLVVWLIANLIPGEATGWTAWRALPTVEAAATLFLLTVAAIIGARFGYRWTHARRR